MDGHSNAQYFLSRFGYNVPRAVATVGWRHDQARSVCAENSRFSPLIFSHFYFSGITKIPFSP
jgi:hypothetical protein